jgi:UDP-N-acetylmuramyl tripeptide synthase
VDELGVIFRGDVAVDVSLGLPGVFNRVNACFTLAAMEHVGIDVATAAARLSTVQSVQGRYGTRRFGARSVRLLLAKNPAGVAALLDNLDEVNDEVWVSINAQIADGKDPSWLYDAPFEKLRGRKIRCLGERSLDIAYRLEVDDVEATVVNDRSELDQTGEAVTIIANYTAFQDWMKVTTPC